ncbi:DnaB-like helicase C-terminal domain-containing protein [Clostridium perfringens]|nr:DnaB-like helicase C-terminal domain-containing protein [Clostridium perfringens]
MKSRQQMADACNLAIPYLFDVDRRKWVKNFSRESVLYISTELEKEEVQTCFLAYVSGVPEAHILDNMYEEGEEERVDRAIELLEESDLFVEYISDFDIDDIQNLIELYIINHDIGYAFFDYIHLAPKLMASTTKAMGTKLREDQILYLFGVVLKAMANKYNIFLQSSTQLNRGYKEDGNLDASALRGAMSLGDKLDIGIISLPVTIKELEKLEPIIKKLQDNTFGNRNNCVPTMSHTIYKNRGNKKNAIRIWTRMELDNIREKTIFVTNMDYKIIDEQLDKVAFCPPNSDLDNEILDYLNGHTNVRPEKLYVPKISKEKLQDVT